jgi:metallo-beta-lactamase family protein
MKLSFHGADNGVTGSCHLVEYHGRRILIDCGLYQGSRELDEENARPFGFDPSAIDFVLLTHAHLDHCGRLPLLAKQGFQGEIITTSASRELARLVMLDAAHLNEEETRYREHKSEYRGDNQKYNEPLYTTLDALNCLDYFGRTAVYGQPLELTPGVHVTFLDAGHILGSSSILLELQEQGIRRLLFSGDLGNAGRPLLRDPVVPTDTDIVVMETTYGDRQHKSVPASVDELYEAVRHTLRHGGNVVIPTFALERAQELLYFLREGLEKDRLPASLQVFLDSPMAISATQIFKRHPECYNRQTTELFREGRDPFQLPGLHFTRETAESIAINRISKGAIIMAGAGMCTGGRIRHHLRKNLGRQEASIVFVGYAAHGTLARQIIDGAKQVRLFGDEIQVRARIYTIGGFSAHADQRELLDWHHKTHARHTFLVHGEEGVMRSFAAHLRNTQIEMPQPNQKFEL